MAELDLGRVVGKDGRDGTDGLSHNANLLDNAYFLDPVNQRGQTSYNAKGYTIDRWRVANSTVTVTLTAAGVQVSTGGALRQYITADTSGDLTAAVCTSDGTIYCATGNLASGAIKGSVFEVGTDDTGVYMFLFEGQTYRWAALYKGNYTLETLPEFTPKGYASELLECQRYFIRMKSFHVAGQMLTTGGRFGFTLPVQMRITPTLTVTTKGTIICNGVKDIAVTGATLNAINRNRIQVYTEHESQSGWSNQTGTWLNGEFELSADL